MERACKHWTAEEDAYLEDKWGIYSIGKIAKDLGRTQKAVVTRKERLGIGRYIDSGDFISFTHVVKTIYSWDSQDSRDYLISIGCPVERKKVHRNSIQVIKPSKLWKWLEANKHLVNLSKMEQYDFGPEPEWVDHKRLEDKRNKEKHSTKNAWTQEDDKRLEMLVSQYVYSYKDIAKRMKRTEASICARCRRLGLMAKPTKQEARWWTTKEVEKLHKMLEEGHSYMDIADELGRSAKSVKGRIERENKKAPITDQSKIGASKNITQ